MKIITCCTTLVAIIQLSLMRVVESLLRDGLPARLTIRPSPPSSTVPISPLTTAPHPTRKWNHGANNCLTTNTRTITRSQRLYLATPNPRRKSGDSVYGQGRGSVLLGVVLLLNVWIFSIPPTFAVFTGVPHPPALKTMLPVTTVSLYQSGPQELQNIIEMEGELSLILPLLPRQRNFGMMP